MVRPEPEYVSDGVDWGNRYSYDWSPLAPVQYETDEEGVVPGKMWEDESGEYSPIIHTQVFQLSIPALSDNLIYELIERYRYDDSLEEFVDIEHPDLDLLIVYGEEDSKKVFASKGKAVMYVQYYGYADINSLIENIVEKITLISD
jgi:hypothetical protein